MKTKQQLTRAIARALFAVTLLVISPTLFAQVKIGSNPTVINAANNLEVEASTVGNKVSVDKATGKVTIADGSQGVGKILTSDASGVATWTGSKSTGIYSFGQSANAIINLPTGSGVCLSLACATDLGRDGSFTITKPVSDVVIDITGTYALAGNNTSLQYYIYLAIDKTTPDTYEAITYFPMLHSPIGCYGMAINLKSVMQNLPPRAIPYKVKVYASAFTNVGSPAILAIGGQPIPGCGVPLSDQKLIVSVSE